MSSRKLAPSTKNFPPIIPSEKAHPTKPLITNGGPNHDFATDHGLNQAHDDQAHDYELDRHITPVKPHSLALTAPPASRAHTLMRGGGDRHFSSSDDGVLTKQILATHALDHEQLDVKPVLNIVEDVMRLAKPSTIETAHIQGAHIQGHVDHVQLDDKVYGSSYHDADIVQVLAFPINKISCEIICKCAAGVEAHHVTIDLLKSLANYSWDAKAVITFAAFAINYGEFWLVEHYHTKDPLAKNIATLKDLPDTMGHASELKAKFDSVVDLLNTALRVTHCIIEFKELPSQHISHESPEMSTATSHIPTAVYWIIRSLLACASVLLNLIGSGHEYLTSTAESWEILSLGHKLTVMMEHLQKQLHLCKGLIERKKGEDACALFKKLMEGVHIDNMKVLRAMIHAREDQRPLFDGSKKTNERLEVLRMKHVLLLISDLDLPQEELNILHLIYNQAAMRQDYEVLWLPIITSTESFNEQQFHELRNNMPWHSVDHPSLIEHVAVRYIREVWNFTHMPMLVVLDPQGKPSNLDALPMMWIWGSAGFPFTKTRERDLWSESSWNIDLLAGSIDPRITEWIRDNKVICLYGGEDIDWIRKFTLSTRAVSNALHVPLEMLYVGKRNPKERVRRCHEIIDREKLSHIFSLKDYYDYIWFFWVRLLSMWNSKKQIGKSAETDPVMKEIMNLLTFDSSDEGWAVFSRGNSEMTKGKGDVVLSVMDNYNSWGYKVDHVDKFVSVLDEEISGTHLEHHCNRLILPGHAGYIPEKVVCSECGKTMDKYVMYRCCTD